MAGLAPDLTRLKSSVESWREVVIIIDSVLAWDKVCTCYT